MLKKIREILSKWRIIRSLKFRIFLIILAVGFIPSLILRYGILQNYEERAISVKTSEVRTQFKILANHLITYDYLTAPTSDVINAELDQLSTLYDGRVLIVDQNFTIIKDTYGISEGKIMISEEVIRAFSGESIVSYDDQNLYLEMVTPIEDIVAKNSKQDASVPPSIKGVLVTSVATDSIQTNVDILSDKAAILQVIMSFALIGIAWGLSHVLVQPFQKVVSAISEVKEGFYTERVVVMNYLETEQIIEAFNELLKKMKVLDDSRQEFVSNVSHELKTPITSMKVLADSLIAQEDVPVELYKEFMVDIADEIERENKIINDLLSLVKLDKTAPDLNIEVIDVNSLLELILKRLRPIAKQRDIDVIFESAREVVAEVDEVKLTLAVSNLVENAIKYNNDHGYVKLSLDADHQFFTITVEDNGPGIPEDAVEHIFERFYRVDKSHSREIGGTGLGLAITRNAILMHRGSIKVDSEEGAGTSFIVKVPVTYIVK